MIDRLYTGCHIGNNHHSYCSVYHESVPRPRNALSEDNVSSIANFKTKLTNITKHYGS